MKVIWIGLVLIVLAISCKNQKESVNTLEDIQESVVVGLEDTVHNSKNSLDWKGTYSGILPCADCMGIQSQITIKEDGKYESRAVYLGKSDSIYTQNGIYEWGSNGQKIICKVDGEVVSQLKVGENYLEQTSDKGSAASVEMQQLNRLYKNEAKILNTYWEATEILGQEVQEDQYPKTPYLLIRKDGFSATGGCNSMFGTFTLSEKGKQIQFSDLAVSEMVCQKEHLDQELIEVLNRSQQYIIRDGELQLIVGKAAPLAKFKLVMR